MTTRFSLSALLLLLFLLPASAGAAEYPRDENEAWLSLASHGWKDLDPVAGKTRAEDKGLSIGVGWEGVYEGKDWAGYWRPRLQAYAGKSDYTEGTPSGEISSDSNLVGLSAGLDYLYRIPVGRYAAIEPVAGMAVRWDRRVVKGGSAGSQADNTLVERGRFREEKAGFIGRLGLRAVARELGGAGDERVLGESARDLFIEGGLLVPVYVDYQGGLDGDTIRTKLYPGVYFEGGVRVGRFRPTVFYEGFRYGTKGYSFSGDLRAQSDVIG
ncbi:MAG TPA: hypothetical protein VIU29_08490, partial [Candidatus Deferrimicrobiaceae bacterium]